jgi:hypothetical protein
VYALDEAIADAMASPLVFVGKYGIPGLHRIMACTYRNDRVFVVDIYCTEKEMTTFSVAIISPARGRVTFYAEGDQPISTLRSRADYVDAFRADIRTPDPRVTLTSAHAQLFPAQPTQNADAGSCSIGVAEMRCFGALNTRWRELRSRNQAFILAPPTAWFGLVHDLVAQRGRNRGTVTPENRLAWALSWVTREGLLIDFESKIGSTDGSFAPIVVTDDGGYVVAGGHKARGKATHVPRVVRFDGAGKVVWDHALQASAGANHAASAVMLPDGFIVAVTASFPAQTVRLHRLDRRGKIVWSWQSRLDGLQLKKATLTQAQTIVLEGERHVGGTYGAGAPEIYRWDATVELSGRAVRDQQGQLIWREQTKAD